MPALRLESRGDTDAGRVRSINEDSLLSNDLYGLWAVADGMGGHEHGGWASQTLAQCLANVAGADDFDALVAATSDAIHAANGVIYDQSRRINSSMGTTVVALALRDGRFALMWAGDSRAYVLRDGSLHQLTRDHTQVQELLDRGILTLQQSLNHPMGHVLSRAVGVSADLELDAITDLVRAGDVFLLCSDGLHGVLGESDIRDILSGTPTETAPAVLIEKCLVRGAPDNVTAVVVKAVEATVLNLAGSASAGS